jgi:hypothetical protein
VAVPQVAWPPQKARAQKRAAKNLSKRINALQIFDALDALCVPKKRSIAKAIAYAGAAVKNRVRAVRARAHPGGERRRPLVRLSASSRPASRCVRGRARRPNSSLRARALALKVGAKSGTFNPREKCRPHVLLASNFRASMPAIRARETHF